MAEDSGQSQLPHRLSTARELKSTPTGIVAKGLEFRTRGHGSALPYIQTFELPQNRYLFHLYLTAGRTNVTVPIRGRVHLIPGHPSINAEANALFRDYQRQAARGEIQFRRWPLRAVSSLAYFSTTLIS